MVRPACTREKTPDDALDGVDFFVGAGLVAFVRDFDEEEAGAEAHDVQARQGDALAGEAAIR